MALLAETFNGLTHATIPTQNACLNQEEKTMAIGILAHLKIQPGKSQEFETIFAELEAAVRHNEPGNNFYACHRTDDPTVYVVMEQYKDEAAVHAHRTSDHFKTIGAKLGSVMAGRADVKTMASIG